MGLLALVAVTVVTGVPGSLSPASEPARTLAPQEATGNILLIVADDLSISDLAVYAVNPHAPPGLTPNIDQLAARGVLFENAWSNPTCSATRALLLTGQHAFRTGIGNVIEKGAIGLSESETTLPEALKALADPAYATAAFGKWHLEARRSPVACPATELHGFDHFAGTPHGIIGSYCDWPELVCPGPADSAGPRAEYMLDTVTDRAVRWIAARSTPWFVYYAPQSPYDKLHVPPTELQSHVRGSACSPCDEGDRTCFEAALQALDTKVGALLDGLGPDWEASTTVVIAGDNGTPTNVLDYWPPKHGKGTLFEGGIHVPLIVAGRGVGEASGGTRTSELVGLSDVFRTVTSLAGIAELPEDVARDSMDLGPLLRGEPGATGRASLMAERFSRNGIAPPFAGHRIALRDQRFKLIHDVAGSTALGFFDLEADPLEGHGVLLHVTLELGQFSAVGERLQQLEGRPGQLEVELRPVRGELVGLQLRLGEVLFTEEHFRPLELLPGAAQLLLGDGDFRLGLPDLLRKLAFHVFFQVLLRESQLEFCLVDVAGGLVPDDLQVLSRPDEGRLAVHLADLLVDLPVLQAAGIELHQKVSLADPCPLGDEAYDRRSPLDFVLDDDLLLGLDRSRLGDADSEGTPLHREDRLGLLRLLSPGKDRQQEDGEPRGSDEGNRYFRARAFAVSCQVGSSSSSRGLNSFQSPFSSTSRTPRSRCSSNSAMR